MQRHDLINNIDIISSKNERVGGEQVLVIENPEVLISAEERAAAVNNPDIIPNPLAWLPPELPSHVKASDIAVMK